MKYVTGLQCINCQKTLLPLPDQYLCPDCGSEGLLDVSYDYEAISADWSKADLAASTEQTMWRYRPLLPVAAQSALPPLRVGWTPVYQGAALGKELGVNNLVIKDDGLNPTASLKDRASAMAVVKAQEAGAEVVCCASTGNAASSLAGNVASLGGKMRAVIFVPNRAPQGKVAQLLVFGAVVFSVEGSYGEAFRLSAAAIQEYGWYSRNAAINPYLMEGKKTAVLELMEQLNWEVPDWVVVSVGDGCTIAGVWKGLWDLYQIGFITKLPKLLGVQAAGCAPITEAYYSKNPLVPCEENTLADSIAVGSPRNWRKAIMGIQASGGEMVNVSDKEILEAMALLGKTTGVFGEPAGVTGVAGIKAAVRQGIIKPQDRVATIITGNGLKDIKNALNAVGTPYSVQPRLSELPSVLDPLDLH